MKPENIFSGPALVVIDARAKTYTRYFGAKRTLKVQGEQTLTAAEVEMYRADPHKFMGMEAA